MNYKKKEKNVISINSVDVFIFDFDGVLTNNLVNINHDGVESVTCSRADGLAFDALKKLNKPSYIVSTESNPVVNERAKKLQIQVIYGVKNKLTTLKSLSKEKNYSLSKILYVGNDLNDYTAMNASGFSVCPSDSHPLIKDLADVTLKTAGGMGVVRELLEDVLSLNLLEILYNN